MRAVLLTATFLIGAVPLTFLLITPLTQLLSQGLSFIEKEPLWADPFFWNTVFFTYWQALISALLSALLGIFGAWVITQVSFIGRIQLWRYSLIGSTLPPILVVLAFVGFWGRQGTLNCILELLGLPKFDHLYGWFGILTAHVFFNFPLFLRAIGTQLLNMESSQERAALSLGASQLYCFFNITLRKLFPTLRGCFFLVFLLCSASFLVVLMLGGGPRFTSLEVAIYQSTKIDFDLKMAASLALFQLVVSIPLFLAWNHWNPKNTMGAFTKIATPLFAPRSAVVRILVVTGYFSIVTLVVGGPLISLTVQGIFGMKALFSKEVAKGLIHTIELGLLTSVGSLGLGFALSYFRKHCSSVAARNLVALLASLPMVISTVLLMLAMLLTYPDFMYGLRGSLIPIAIVQTIVCLPLVCRLFDDSFSMLPHSLYQSAQSLGANPLHTLFWIEIPMIGRKFLLAFLFSFGFSMGETGAILMFVDENLNPLPLLLFRWMGQYKFEQAHALGLLLLVLMAVLSWGTSQIESKYAPHT